MDREQLRVGPKRGSGWRLLPLFLCSCSGWVSAADYDLVIRGGRVIDGTGNPAYHADVAVQGGRIAVVGKVPGQGRVELDASGKVVTPGFIDVHTHAEKVTNLPLAENFTRMGVTTVVMGNCGGSVVDVEDYFKRVEATNVSVNVATLIGHGTIRRKAMGGSFDRAPTEAEMAEMKRLVAEGMEAGAVGLSTGLIYLPGSFATTEELIEVAKVAAAYDGIYASHMRNESARILDALAELFEIAREAGIRAEVSHLKLGGKANWGQADRVLEAIEQARASGLDITHDQYAYTASSTGMSQLIPNDALVGGKFKERLNDPEEKARIAAWMKNRVGERGYGDYRYAVIAHYRHDPALNGLNIAEAAQRTRGSDSLDDQVEMVLEIQKNGGASGVFHGMSEEDLQRFMRHPNTMVAADSGMRRFGRGVPHPRGYGNNARVLSRYVRDLGVLRLEDAIRRMTSLPAATFRFDRRGLLAEGYWADMVIFDPAEVQERTTYKEPHQYATGFAGVYVNGEAVIVNDRHTGARPGRVLRHR